MVCDHLREIAALRKQVDDLEAEVEYLKSELDEFKMSFESEAENIWRAFDVSIYQSRTLALLASGRIVTRDTLARVCLRDGGENVRNVDCQIKRIRNHNPGLKIKNVYGVGYVMEGESLARIRAAMKGEPQNGAIAKFRTPVDRRSSSLSSHCPAGVQG